MGIDREIRKSAMARRLKRHGYKLTKPRLAVVQVLEAGPHHLSPSEVYERAQQLHPSLGQTTVYRTLELLTQLGALRATYMGDASQRFHRTTDGHHDHCVCSACGDVMEVGECFLGSALEKIERETGFQIEGHFLELYGTCPDCKTGERVGG